MYGKRRYTEWFSNEFFEVKKKKIVVDSVRGYVTAILESCFVSTIADGFATTRMNRVTPYARAQL